jgi:hypothetical protein
MAPGQEKRMIPAMMEGDGAGERRRWWKTLKGG